MILVNGTIHTGTPGAPSLPLIAIEGERIGGTGAVGERIDLDGRCVVPGFTDAHLHSVEWALSLRRLDLRATRCHADVIAAVATDPGTGWLVGAGWRESLWPAGDPRPHRLSLDAATARPCALLAHDYHSLWLSSAAIAELGLPSEGIVDREAGILREDASWDTWARLPQPGETELDEAMQLAVSAAHRRGVTGIHDFQRQHGLASWQRIGARLRVWASLPAAQLDAITDLGLRSGLGDRYLQIGMVKAFADGTLGSRTASMLEPFADGGVGEALLSGVELHALAERCGNAGLDLAVHAIGDGANRAVLDALEATRMSWQPHGCRPRIEHCQLLDPADLPRFAELGVIASMQPSHAPSDRQVAQAAWGARCDTAYALGSLQRSGARLCFSSDAPIEPVDPLAGVQAAVTRDWPSSEALAPLTALDGFWGGAAWARHAEAHSGRLLAGYDADLVVLDRDPLACPLDEIGAIGIVATMVGGRFVHGAPPW